MAKVLSRSLNINVVADLKNNNQNFVFKQIYSSNILYNMKKIIINVIFKIM